MESGQRRYVVTVQSLLSRGTTFQRGEVLTAEELGTRVQRLLDVGAIRPYDPRDDPLASDGESEN